MIDASCRRESRYRVAVFADVGRLNVPRRLADCLNVVVATGTVRREVGMIEVRR